MHTHTAKEVQLVDSTKNRERPHNKINIGQHVPKETSQRGYQVDKACVKIFTDLKYQKN